MTTPLFATLRPACLVALLAATIAALAHNGEQPSVHDAVAGIKKRLTTERPPEELVKLTEESLLELLTQEEREVLATGWIGFDINVPAKVTILSQQEVFWLKDREFDSGDEAEWELSQGKYKLRPWSKDFQPGRVGLGVHSLTKGKEPYLISVAPLQADTTIEITNLYPGQLRAVAWAKDVKVLADTDVSLKGDVPDAYAGQMLIQTLRDNRDDPALTGIFRMTQHLATDFPDQVILTWSQDPKTTQSIQWRTSTDIQRGVVAYQKKALMNRFQPITRLQQEASVEVIEDPYLVNDPRCHRFEVTLDNLDPGTTYLYSVGNGDPNGWTELAEFTTAPEGVVPFSFIYMGDAQNGLDRWGTLVKNAFRERPDAAFYVMAGDLVNRGNDRDDWDSFYHNAANIYDRRQLVPAIGNHENQGGHPTLYLKTFTLPLNGASEIEKERSYWFEYSNALFVILDTNLAPKDQAPWLDQVLGQSAATWKFVVYHHPAYSSAPNRDNKDVREHWIPIFDKYHVDLALQGHDHAYLRTFPMKAEKRVESPKDGTVYIVSVSGTKMYDQDPRDYTEYGFTQISTYQVLDIQLAGDRLLYRAYDLDGRLRDELEIIKNN